MAEGPRLRLARGSMVEETGPGEVVVRRGSFRAPFGDLGEGARDAFRALHGAGGDERKLASYARRDGASALLRFLQILEAIHSSPSSRSAAPPRGGSPLGHPPAP